MKLLTLALLIFSVTAQAEIRMMVTESFQRTPVDSDPTHIPSKTQYQVLEYKYEAAKGLEVKDVKGWYAGRCFFRDTPSHAVATLLAADNSSGLKTNGPLFQAPEYRHLTPIIDTIAVATSFDTLDTPKSSVIQKVLNDTRELNAFPVRSNEELVISGHRTADLEARAYRVRKLGSTLFLKLECAEVSSCSNINKWASNNFLAYEGDPVAYCYYFKKVRP